MSRPLAWLSTALVLMVGAGYQWLVHAAVVGALPEPWRLLLKLVPLALLALWALLRARRKLAWLLGIAAAAGVVVWLDSVPQGSVAAYGLPHAAAYLSLLWLFGNTLRPGHEALITQLAGRVHGPLEPRMRAYTRGVTIAWCLFFAAQLAASVLLYSYASLDAWSIYITMLHLPLVLLMFVAEYFFRRWGCPEHPHTSIPRAIRAFTEHGEPDEHGARP